MDVDITIDITINLRVLSCLKPFQRINTRGPLFQIKQQHFVPEFIQRWWEGSTRESDFARIQDLYIAAIERTNSIGMTTHMLSSLIGLNSLKKTYENDTTMVARIDTLIERVNIAAHKAAGTASV